MTASRFALDDLMINRIWLGLRDGVRAASWNVAEVFGEHNYDRYLADWSARHPDRAPDPAHRPLTAAEYFDLRLEKKYGGGVSRC